jgi:methylmalonyl-CoA epimerase
MRIKRIHHLTLAVRDVEGARVTFAELFGTPAGSSRMVQSFGVRASDVPFGDTTLRLVAPVSRDNAVQRFLERRGEGVYNVALEVEDLDLAVAELTSQGIRVSEPVEAEDGMRSAFVTMAATHGLSIQLVEIAEEEDGDQPVIAPVTRVDEPRAEHLPDNPDPPAGAAVGEPAPRKIDLTPDEWSDTD